MLTVDDYLTPIRGKKDLWDRYQKLNSKANIEKNISILIQRVNLLLDEIRSTSRIPKDLKINFNHLQYGQSFRFQDVSFGAKNSLHKQGKAIDIGRSIIEGWTLEELQDSITEKLLHKHQLRKESPKYTPNHIHLDIGYDKNKNVIFIP